MAILCCCSQLRNKRQQTEQEPPDDRNSEEPELPHGQRLTHRSPTRPRPAKLPPPTSSRLVLSSQSTAARSSLTNALPGAAADASIQPAELVIEDSEDDNGLEALRSRKNRSTSTLDAVKARIRRHLSQDSISRQGETEEQIAHRAQVKRLMRKRIQEELQSETGDVVSRSSTPQNLAQATIAYAGNGPRDTIEFTMDEVQEQEHKELLRGKVLSVEDGKRRLSKTMSKRSSAPTFGGKENRQFHSRSNSLGDGLRDNLVDSQAGDHRLHLRQGVSLPHITASPVLHPSCVPSLHDASSFTSWRLSLNVDNLADLLTPDNNLSGFRPIASPAGSCSTVDELEQRCIRRFRSRSSPLVVENDAARMQTSQASLSLGYQRRVPASHSLIRDESPVGLWLRTQDPQFGSLTASRPQSDCGHEISCDDAPNGAWKNTSVQTFPTQAQQEKSPPNTEPMHPPTSKAQLDTLPSTTCVPTLVAEYDITEDVPGCVVDFGSVSRGIASGLSLARPLTSCSQGSTGTVQNSKMPHTATSGRNLAQKSNGGLRLSSFNWYRSTSSRTQDENNNNSRLTPCPDNSNPYTALPVTQLTTTEDGSETSSVFHREAELRTVEQRFRDSRHRHELSTPTESKFRELFHDRPKSGSGNSFLVKLTASVAQETAGAIENCKGHFPGNFLSARLSENKFLTQKDGSEDPSGDCHLKVPSTGHGLHGLKGKPISPTKSPRLSTKRDDSLHPRGFSSSKDGDDTAAMWGRAIRAESVTRSHRSSFSSRQVAVLHPTPEAASVHGQIAQGHQPSEDGRVRRSDSVVHSPSCHELPAQEDEEEFRKSLVRSNIILEEWARQLQHQERGLAAKSQAPPSAHHPNATPWKLPPASWSKFPSHDREERNADAGKMDDVIAKDFAVNAVSPTGDISWVTDKGVTGAPSHRSVVRSLSDKFTHSFKFRWAKIIPGHPKTPHKDKSMRGARRSSIQTSGILEYPELELLPTAGGYSELQALEKEINEMKGFSGVNTRAPSNKLVSTTTGNRRHLTEKMAGGVLQHDGGSDADLSRTTDTGVVVKRRTSAVRICCLDPTFTEYSSGSSRERYLTPCTHLSSCQSVKSRPVTPRTPERNTVYTSEDDRTKLPVPDTATGFDLIVTQPEDWKGQGNADNRRLSAQIPVAPTLD